jgi:hypothetical protein
MRVDIAELFECSKGDLTIPGSVGASNCANSLTCRAIQLERGRGSARIVHDKLRKLPDICSECGMVH